MENGKEKNMPSAERGGFLRNTVELSKKVDVLTGVVGVVIGSAPVVALAIVSYLAGNEIGKRIDKKST